MERAVLTSALLDIDLWRLRVAKVAAAATSRLLLRALVKHRVLAATEHVNVVARDLKCLIDVGANKGQFSLAFRNLNPSAQIHAFEPLKLAAATFRRVFEGDARSELHELAIGASDGTAEIHISRRDDSSSLLPIGSLQTTHFPGTDELQTSEVTVVRLLTALRGQKLARPALLKIDVQGFELEVLKGCEEYLDQFSLIYCECSYIQLYDGQALAHQIISYLAPKGFVLRGTYNPAYARDGSPVQADFLFERAVS